MIKQNRTLEQTENGNNVEKTLNKLIANWLPKILKQTVCQCKAHTSQVGFIVGVPVFISSISCFYSHSLRVAEEVASCKLECGIER